MRYDAFQRERVAPGSLEEVLLWVRIRTERRATRQSRARDSGALVVLVRDYLPVVK
jgi:hypothetical protein